MGETMPLRAVDLLIDEENPRISQPNAGQRAALQTLAKKAGERKLLNLASDIVESGGVDPSNLFIVKPHEEDPHRHIVLEGNRRLGAIRALENPETLSGAVSGPVLQGFRKLSGAYLENPVEEVNCLVVKNREEAQHWIQLRHTGENEGRGVVPWGADEKARFRARTAPAPLHTQVLDWLEKRGVLSREKRAAVPSTTLKRLVEDPDVRDKLGIERQSGDLALVGDEKRVAKALMYVIDALASGRTKVTDVYTKKKRLEYAEALPKHVVVPPAKPSGKGTPVGGATATTKKRRKAAPKRRRPRDRLIPSDCSLEATEGRPAEIENELRKLSLKAYPNAISVLLRVFIELTADAYIDQRKLTSATVDNTLNKKLEAVTEDLEARQKISTQQARAMRRYWSSDSLLAPSTRLMHSYIHNAHIFPAANDLRAHWDSMQPFVVACWAQ